MTKTTVLNVQGMTCGHCEMSVQEALDELDGVQGAKADRATGNVEVTYEEDKVSNDEFKEAIEEVGYKVGS